jgi:hypothetical protein
MSNVNELFNNKIEIDRTFELLTKQDWVLITFNDEVIITKKDESMGKYFFKSINFTHLNCANSKIRPPKSGKFNYVPFKFNLKNIESIYRKSKIFIDCCIRRTINIFNY